MAFEAAAAAAEEEEERPKSADGRSSGATTDLSAPLASAPMRSRYAPALRLLRLFVLALASASFAPESALLELRLGRLSCELRLPEKIELRSKSKLSRLESESSQPIRLKRSVVIVCCEKRRRNQAQAEPSNRCRRLSQIQTQVRLVDSSASLWHLGGAFRERLSL